MSIPDPKQTAGREADYEAKRASEKTPEPPAEIRGNVDPGLARPGRSFVIHKHYARRLHFDLRLEMYHGDTPVLVSWAVPKNLPKAKGVRSLAIHVEDHPFDYGSFSGTIPEGNYGAGEVRIFDSGTYEMLEQRPGKLVFRLEGKRLRGSYHLVRTKEGDKEEWLALLGEPAAHTRDQPPAPDPMLAAANGEPFDDPGWAFEPKWDGLRAIALCQDQTKLISRNRNDVTAAYPELHKLHERLVAMDAMVDGEIVCFEAGRPSFEQLQSRMHVRDPRQIERLAKTLPVTYIAFDLLYLDGRNLVRSPFEERRALLEEIAVASQVFQVSPSIRGTGIALFEAARAQRLEGIVAKRASSPYEVGRRSGHWRKIKAVFDCDVVIGGWSAGKGRRSGGLGALLMGAYANDELRFVGEVGTGFDDPTLSWLLSELQRRRVERSPFDPASMQDVPREVRHAHWVRPELVATVEFRELTSAGKLRAGSFKGLRTDKPPQACTYAELERSARISMDKPWRT